MMLGYVKNIIRLKAGVNFTPALIILFYYILVGLDIYTTYLATPNLNYEVNFVIRFFDLNWNQIIILAFIGTTLLSYFFVVSSNFLTSYYQKSRIFNNSFFPEAFQEKRILLGILLIGFFYSHFFTSIFVIINNYLNYLYLYKIDNYLKDIATSYVKLESMFFPVYYIYTRIITVSLGFLFTIYRLKNIKNKFSILQSENLS